MTLSLRLFGAPDLLVDSRSLLLSRPKAMALLAYVAVTRRHHRETLAALLWPESDASAAYSALRNMLWILRQTSLAEAIHSDRSTVELADHEAVDVDVNQFRELTSHCPTQSYNRNSQRAICEPQLRKAVALWKGPFMRGFAVVNSVTFDDWQIAAGWLAHYRWTDRSPKRVSGGLEQLGNVAPKTRLHAMANMVCAYASSGTDIEGHAYRSQASAAFDQAGGQQWGEGLVLSLLARLSEARGDLHLTRTRYGENQRLSEPIAGDIGGVIEAIVGQARVLGRLGDVKRSEALAHAGSRLEPGHRKPTPDGARTYRACRSATVA